MVTGLPGVAGAPVQWRAGVAFKHGHETAPILHHNMEERTVPTSQRRHKRATPITVQVSFIYISMSIWSCMQFWLTI